MGKFGIQLAVKFLGMFGLENLGMIFLKMLSVFGGIVECFCGYSLDVFGNC